MPQRRWNWQQQQACCSGVRRSGGTCGPPHARASVKPANTVITDAVAWQAFTNVRATFLNNDLDRIGPDQWSPPDTDTPDATTAAARFGRACVTRSLDPASRVRVVELEAVPAPDTRSYARRPTGLNAPSGRPGPVTADWSTMSNTAMTTLGAQATVNYTDPTTLPDQLPPDWRTVLGPVTFPVTCGGQTSDTDITLHDPSAIAPSFAWTCPVTAPGADGYAR